MSPPVKAPERRTRLSVIPSIFSHDTGSIEVFQIASHREREYVWYSYLFFFWCLLEIGWCGAAPQG